ncbi:MAG: DUF2339 domain-containing protein [bacterium]|nr:DUF2339 domain-containing protein [bacterium]
MKEPTNAELAFRLKQLEDRLRSARVDVDRIQSEVNDLREVLAGRNAAASTQPANQAAPPKISDKSSEKVASQGSQTVSGKRIEQSPVKSAAASAESAQSKQRSVAGSTAAVPDARPAQPSLLSQAIAAIKSRIGGIPLEEFVGLNLLNKIGVLMLVVGGGFFLRIAYQWVGPELKLAGLTLLASAALLGGEYFFRKRGDNFRMFGLGLAAGGSVLLFFNAFAAYHVEATRVIPPERSLFAYFLLLIVAAGIVANSLRYDSEAFTGFAYFLAFISISINESEASVERFTGHFALIALAILAASLILVLSLRRWKFLGVLGLLGTYANFFWYATALPRTLEGFVWRGEALTELQNFIDHSGTGPDYFLFAFLYLAIYFFVFAVSVFSMPADDAVSRRVGVWLNVANVLCFYFLVAYIRPPSTAWGSFAITGGLGLAVLLIGVLGRIFGREHLWTSSVLLGVGLLALAIPFRFSEYGLAFGWLVQATVLIALGYSLREGLFRYAGYFVLLLNFGAFLDLPAGDLFYGYGPEVLIDSEGDAAGQGLPEAGAPLWAFDWNRGLLYVFMILCFFGLQIFAALVARFPSTATDAKPGAAALPVDRVSVPPASIDRIAWHVLGAAGGIVAFLLAHYSLLVGQQALLLVPFALLLIVAHRLLRIAPFLLYAVVLLWAALFSAGALVVVNEGPGEVLFQRLSLILLFAGGALCFFYQRRFAPDAFASDGVSAGESPGEASDSPLDTGVWRVPGRVSGRLLAGLALWLPAIVLPAFAGHHIDARITILGAVLGASALGAIYWRYRQGLLALYTLASFSILFVLGLYFAQLFDTDDFQDLFLYNSAWLMIATLCGAIALHVYKAARIDSTSTLRSSGFAFAALLSVGALIALGWIQISVAAVYAPASIAAYALLMAGVLNWRRELSGRWLSAALSGLAFLIGPLHWVLLRGSGKDLEGTALDPVNAVVSFGVIAGLPLLAAGIAFFNHPARRVRDFSALLTLGFLLAAIHLLVPQIYRPSGYALMTLLIYYLLGKLKADSEQSTASGSQPQEWQQLYRIAPLAFLFTMLSFAALLLHSAGVARVDDASSPLILRAIMGVVPLVFLTFSLTLHGDLYGGEELTPFQRAGYPALLLALVLLSMSLFDIGWWSLAWAALGVAALVVGILKNWKLLRYGGFALILLALLKLSLWDVRELESTARVIVLVCVGVSLVVASYFYARFKDLLFPKE